MRCVWSQKVRDGGVREVRQEAVVADHQAAEVPVQDQAALQGLFQYNKNFIYNGILYMFMYYSEREIRATARTIIGEG